MSVADAAPPWLLNALREDNQGHAFVRALLDRVPLPAEHKEAALTLMKLQAEAIQQAESAADSTKRASERSSLGAMRNELATLREVNDTLASALGACRLCWGGDADCEVCAGDGASGAFAPDPRLFDRLIAPAMQRVMSKRNRQTKRHRQRTGT